MDCYPQFNKFIFLCQNPERRESSTELVPFSDREDETIPLEKPTNQFYFSSSHDTSHTSAYAQHKMETSDTGFTQVNASIAIIIFIINFLLPQQEKSRYKFTTILLLSDIIESNVNLFLAYTPTF